MAALVGDLTGRGLVVVEEPPSSGSAGRPSPIVLPDPDVVALAINPEVDELAVALVGMTGRVRAERRHRFRSVLSAEQTVAALSALLPELAAAVRSPGSSAPVSPSPAWSALRDGVVEWAPHLGWTDAPVADLFAEAIGLPVAVGNDATLGAIAEHLFGAGRGVSDLVYLNGGASGIGGGIVVDGQAARRRGRVRRRVRAPPAAGREPAARGRAGGQPRSAGGRAERPVGGPGHPAPRRLAATEPAATAEIARQTDFLAVLVANAVQRPQPRTASCSADSSARCTTPTRSGSASWSADAACRRCSGRCGLTATALGDELLLVGAAELGVPATAGRPRYERGAHRTLAMTASVISPTPLRDGCPVHSF